MTTEAEKVHAEKVLKHLIEHMREEGFDQFKLTDDPKADAVKIVRIIRQT